MPKSIENKSTPPESGQDQLGLDGIYAGVAYRIIEKSGKRYIAIQPKMLAILVS